MPDARLFDAAKEMNKFPSMKQDSLTIEVFFSFLRSRNCGIRNHIDLINWERDSRSWLVVNCHQYERRNEDHSSDVELILRAKNFNANSVYFMPPLAHWDSHINKTDKSILQLITDEATCECSKRSIHLTTASESFRGYAQCEKHLFLLICKAWQ